MTKVLGVYTHRANESEMFCYCFGFRQMRDIEQITTESVVLNSEDVLRSRYRILHQLGHEGFSCVLKEFAPQLKETYALLKVQELFEREAAVLYRLQHSQITQFRQLFSYERENEGCLFLVQDYVEGITYQDLLNQRLKANQRFDEAEIKQLLVLVLPILEYIHSMGVNTVRISIFYSLVGK